MGISMGLSYPVMDSEWHASHSDRSGKSLFQRITCYKYNGMHISLKMGLQLSFPWLFFGGYPSRLRHDGRLPTSWGAKSVKTVPVVSKWSCHHCEIEMCLYIYGHVSVHVCMYIYIFIYLIYIYIYISIYTNIYMYVYMCEYVYIYIYA